MFLKLEVSPADGLFKVQQNVEMTCKLISHICSRLPTYASKGYLLLMSLTCQTGVMAAVRKNQVLENEVKDLMSRCQKIMKMAQDPVEKRQSSRKTMGPNEDDETPPEDFTELSIFPTGQDMEWNEKPFLRANKTEGGYKDVNHYLDVQFRLLREDYIRPLRKGIREYKIMKEKGENLKKNPDLRLYHNIKVIGLACKESLEHRIQFDNSHLKNIRWESSKRLLYGSLVCLSSDDFQNTFFAIVTSRDMKDIKQGIIQVQFMNSIREILNASGDTFIMAETTAYFEAYRHVLEGLQEMQTCFPLSRYIVECKTDIKPPQYARGYGTTLNIRYLLKDECRQNTQISVLLPTRWPPVENTPFNQSQYDAVKTALTKEIAIIQGPPGTGKTYVGLKVAKVLLDNREVWTSNAKPMLVVCYTNHALDQFLEGILQFCPNGIVRVGSRCKTEQLERFNLKQIRAQIRKEKRVKLDIKHSINDCFKGLCNLRERVERVSARLEATAKGILGESALRSAMPDNHYSSLVSNIQRRLLGARQSVMINWLTQGMLGESDETSYKGLEQEVTQQILEGTEMQHELSIDASQIPFLHPKMRAQMYRFWVDKVQDRLNQTLSVTVNVQTKQHVLAWRSKCTQEILPDSMLKLVINSNVFSVIAETSSQSPWYHKDYCVKTWLGLSPDTMSLQNLLDQLLEEDEGDEAEKKLNVEEDAEYTQRERQLDDADDDEDDDLFNFARRHKYSVKDAIFDLGIVTTVGKGSDRDMDGWQTPKAHRKQQERRLQHLLKTSQAMSEKEASAITDVWSHRLQVKDRVRLYLFWLDRYQTSLKDSIKTEADLYETEAARMRELKFAEDRDIMRSKAVIGMTTTGAARYRSVLKDIGCPIVLLEEAAELITTWFMTSSRIAMMLSRGLFIKCVGAGGARGDDTERVVSASHPHRRPSAAAAVAHGVRAEQDYNLDISLFERLIKNQLHHTTLTLQHRMKPQIANLVRHVYPHLKDHVTTVNRKRIKGVKQDVFLLHHEGYTTSQITILTGYSGQVFALKSRMKKEAEFYKGVRVTAVDNYQGEENNIIILSLVRSNEEGNVGFLGTDNRVCVALSRARDGLYAIGNFRILAEKSELWKNIAKTAKSNQQLGDCLVLRCENHPTTETKVSNKDVYEKVWAPCVYSRTPLPQEVLRRVWKMYPAGGEGDPHVWAQGYDRMSQRPSYMELHKSL
ncbi:hypothetical protein C0Q70_19513 [Pomacea canaliculata]|uniref:DNA2/NAM7 helicase-like C-terminal domain-containing protein n=1 Tax=Pomacea canaliculata TaxID=400727 RepID=A0A2T7NJJ2_POMCA|nr:hypothetical protein C0Q70_19513 [Pomacea canaliculata]